MWNIYTNLLYVSSYLFSSSFSLAFSTGRMKPQPTHLFILYIQHIENIIHLKEAKTDKFLTIQQQLVHIAFSQGPVLLHNHMHAKVDAAFTKSAEAMTFPVFLSRFGTIIGNTVGNDVSESSMSGTTELLQAVRNFS